MIDSYSATLYGSGILDQAASVLEQRVAVDAANREALDTLGEIYRKQGRLSDALDVYQRLFALAPDDGRAAYLCAVLGGKHPPEWTAPDGLQPAPFVLIRDFLPAAFHDSLLPRVLEAPGDAIVPSTVGNDEYNPDRRISFTVGGLKEIQASFWQHVAVVLPSLFQRLQVTPFTVAKTEVRVRTYRAGNFFEVHRDNSIPATADRVVSFVYFFHRLPRRYTGGELLLLDTSTDSNKYAITKFTRILPVDNALVLFGSRFYHAVLPVECTSPDPGDARFVINGHIRKESAVP
jgi:tetratricopeptide (TPR) repeat protein